ncbi:MAG: hypothetical protein IH631_02460, partial [Candidatus Thorarchaeota archaeon]|nr:hypothetical protein [Candidatus Thorarchaeota archaeon]
MNEEIIDNQDSVELKTTRKPLHLTIVSIGAFLLISLALIVMMDLFITAIAQNLAIAHAGIGEDVTVEPIPTYVLAVRAAAIISLVVSITIGFFGKKMYLHRPGRMLQKLIMVMVCFMVFVMFGIGIGLIVTFALFLWNPSKLADWNDKELNIYRAGFIGLILALMIGELILAIGIGGLAIFVRFFWTPKPFAENTPRMLNIFRIIFLGIIGVIIASDIFLTFGDFAVLSFVSMPLSSILTPLGAGIVSLAPGLLVIIPLYLFLPKVIRDLWNLRPNIETFWREFLYHPMGILGIIIIGTIVCIALFAPYIAPYYWSNPPGTPILLDELLQPPSPEHLLGTNHRGEDIFSRIIYGSQISLMIGFA